MKTNYSITLSAKNADNTTVVLPSQMRASATAFDANDIASIHVVLPSQMRASATIKVYASKE